jgi:DNA-binding MarR family transcriptional regulator
MDVPDPSLLELLSLACTEARKTFAQQVGLSAARMQLLMFVWRREEVSHAALQDHLSLDGATITRLVKQFESESLLNRRIDPHDNRFMLVALTPSGQQTVADLRAAHDTFQNQVLDGVSDEEQAIMLHVLERFRANIRAVQDSG